MRVIRQVEINKLKYHSHAWRLAMLNNCSCSNKSTTLCLSISLRELFKLIRYLFKSSFYSFWITKVYIKSIIGAEYLNELFVVSDNPEEIKFDELPLQFVIKANHGSGFNRIVWDKSKVNWTTIVKQ